VIVGEGVVSLKVIDGALGGAEQGVRAIGGFVVWLALVVEHPKARKAKLPTANASTTRCDPGNVIFAASRTHQPGTPSSPTALRRTRRPAGCKKE
jgi:hypothetical protein